MERIPLDAISPDATFRLREPTGVPELAAAIGRLGQLEPVDLRPLPADSGPGAESGAGPARRFQLLAGFRRVEALRLLQRDTALARVHEGLSDQDAWAVALTGPLFAEPWTAADLDALAPTLRERFPWAEAALAAARQRHSGGKGAKADRAEKAPPAGAAVPPPRRAAADPAAFAHGLAVHASALNEEVAAAWDRWDSIPPAGRKMILEQLRYLTRVLPLLERESP